MAAVQVPAADERAGPQRPQQGQLLFNRQLFGIQAQAVGNGGCHWLGVQRAELASAAVRGRALKIGIANFPRNHAIKRRRGQWWQGGQKMAGAPDPRRQTIRAIGSKTKCANWAWPWASPRRGLSPPLSRLRLGRAHLGRKSAWRVALPAQAACDDWAGANLRSALRQLPFFKPLLAT